MMTVTTLSHSAVDPAAEHVFVVAQQQQEQCGAREQHAREDLDVFGHESERRARDEDDRRGDDDLEGVKAVEALGVFGFAVQRVFHTEAVAERVRGRQGHRAGADDGRVDQQDRHERARRIADGVGERVGDAARVRVVPAYTVAARAKAVKIIIAAAAVFGTMAPMEVSARS